MAFGWVQVYPPFFSVIFFLELISLSMVFRSNSSEELISSDSYSGILFSPQRESVYIELSGDLY